MNKNFSMTFRIYEHNSLAQLISTATDEKKRLKTLFL